MAGSNMIIPNVPVTGMFTPGLPTTSDGRPYIDYTLNVPRPGTYTITLMSANSTGYDPYLYLLQNGMELDRNDDGAGYPNSRITRMLMPGTYIVRASSFRRSITTPTPFTLTIVGG